MILTKHVPRAPQRHRIANQIELFRIGIAQAGGLDLHGRPRAFRDPWPISRLPQFVLDHRVHRHNRHTLRQRHRFALEAPAIDQQRRVALSEDRSVLVHDPGRHTDELVLRAARELRELDTWQATRPSQRQGRRDFQRRGRTQARSEWHVALDEQVPPASERKLPRHANHIVAPIAGGPESCNLLDRPLAALLEILRVDPQHSIAIRRDARVAIQIDGDGKHPPEVVVGVLADQVHAAGSAGEIRRAVVARLERLDYELRRASHNITPPNTSIENPQ